MGNPYIHYYLGQQDGRGMPVFKGSSWQRGYGQTGYGLGGLFRSLGKIAKPMTKSGAKALGNIALTSGVNLLGDVLAGKSVKQAARTRALEGTNAAKMQAIQRVQRYAQTGRRRSRSNRRSRSSRRSTKREKHQEPNAELKRERHRHLRPDVNRPSEREHLLETYSVKYEFRARQIGGVCQN